MEILAIDIGNTAIKFGIFSGSKLKDKKVVADTQWAASIQAIYKKHPKIAHTMLCVSGNFPLENRILLEKYGPITEISSATPIPFETNYQTPETLGADRLALAAAAYYSYPRKNVLVVGTGTCITYDFMDATGVYQGGGISPGIDMRYRSLNDYTHRLPLLQATAPGAFVGKSTASSIHSGIIYGVVYEIDSVITQYQLFFKDLTVILTGGYTEFLQDKLKNSIFANSNFLLEGLNFLSGFIRNDDL